MWCADKAGVKPEAWAETILKAPDRANHTSISSIRIRNDDNKGLYKPRMSLELLVDARHVLHINSLSSFIQTRSVDNMQFIATI